MRSKLARPETLPSFAVPSGNLCSNSKYFPSRLEIAAVLVFGHSPPMSPSDQSSGSPLNAPFFALRQDSIESGSIRGFLFDSGRNFHLDLRAAWTRKHSASETSAPSSSRPTSWPPDGVWIHRFAKKSASPTVAFRFVEKSMFVAPKSGPTTSSIISRISPSPSSKPRTTTTPSGQASSRLSATPNLSTVPSSSAAMATPSSSSPTEPHSSTKPCGVISATSRRR